MIADETHAREAWLRGQLEKLGADDLTTLRSAVEIMSGIVAGDD